MNIDADDILPWFNAACAAGAWVFATWAKFADKSEKRLKVIETELHAMRDEVREEIAAIGERTTKLEGTVENLPGRGEYHKIEMALGRIEGDLRVFNERFMPLARTADRLQEFLLDQAETKKRNARGAAV